MRAIVVLVCLAAAGSAEARSGQGSAAISAADWVEAVNTHRPGEPDAAFAAVATADLVTLGKAISRARGEGVPFLTRALVLHTDIAVAEHDAGERIERRFGDGTIWLEDGRETGRREPSAHWGLALGIAKALADHKDPAGPRVALRWFQTAGALFQLWADCSLLAAYVEEGLGRWPDDARLLLSRGTLHQIYADPRVQQFVRRQNDARPMTIVRQVGPRRPTARGPMAAVWERQAAEADLRRALALDPTLVEARIRLAHVVGDRGNADDAVALAEAALITPLPPFFETYAALILGRNHARAGRFAAARAAFDRAAALAPDAQAPRIGLAHVALAERRPVDAVAGLAATLGPRRSDEVVDTDPWTIYFRIHEPEADVWLTALRAEVR
jgi:tetratricopeptide (TPR) repeat protein